MATAAKALARPHSERRRSERVRLRVTVMVCGTSAVSGPFKEETVTFSINSHGALLTLTANVALGQKVLVINPQNWDEVEARVSRLAGLEGKWSAVAIEFVQPAPQFLLIGAPPKRIMPSYE